MLLHQQTCCRKKGGLSMAPRVGSRLTLGKELSEETLADKARDFTGKGHPSREQGTQENCSATWLAVSRFMLMGLVSRLSLTNHSESFLVVYNIVQTRWMSAGRILGGGWTCGVSFWPFPNSSGWWWLISSVFLTRTSCRKTTHASGYCDAWPGWAVSVSVLPLTDLLGI